MEWTSHEAGKTETLKGQEDDIAIITRDVFKRQTGCSLMGGEFHLKDQITLYIKEKINE